MHKLLSLSAAAALVFTMGVGHAADTDAKTKQQSKMTTCNADPKAKELKGDERKAFMKGCLSANKQEKQQTKMGTCSADFKATGKEGKERQAFMKECHHCGQARCSSCTRHRRRSSGCRGPSSPGSTCSARRQEVTVITRLQRSPRH